MLTPRHKDEGAGARDANPLKQYNKGSHSAGEMESVKLFAACATKLALAGYGLHQAIDGAFVVARWNLSKSLTDLAAVEQFIARVAR